MRNDWHKWVMGGVFAALVIFGSIADAKDPAFNSSTATTCAKAVEQLTDPPSEKDVVYVVTVDCDKMSTGSTGTGWVSSEGYVVTARHVIETDQDYRQVWIRTSKKAYHITSVFVHESYDVARLETKDKLDVETFDLAKDSISLGDHAVAVGFTRRGTKRAELEAIEGAEIENLFTDAYRGDVWPGYSGGPILNDDGEIAGMTYAKDRQGQGFVYAVPLHVLKQIVK